MKNSLAIPVMSMLAVVVIVLAVLFGFAKAELSTTKQNLANTQAELSTNKQSLASTQTELSSTKQSLTHTEGELLTTKQDLANTQAELSTTKQSLASVQTELSITKQNLAGAQYANGLDKLILVDDAKVFGNRIGEVEEAANKLQLVGADIRVRTLLTIGSAGNLDQYEAQLEKLSPSWVDPNGDRKNNLIVLMIALQNRQTGLYYGSVWESALGSNWLRIQTDTMNPLFRSGDYAGGTIQGLDQIMRLIQGK